MCGIAGLISVMNIPDGRQRVERAVSLLRHRGPDYSRVESRGEVHLGHARLSIIDTSEKGHQPMSDSEGRVTVVFNGEIYNYRDLRERLTALGHTFHSESDTEVLLHAYLHYGLEFLHELNGFFAFAIYDHRSGELLLARDRMGIKPLYYRFRDGVLSFASEPKGLQAMNGRAELDPVAMQLFFELNYIPAPLSIFKDIRSLQAGEALQYRNGKVRKWDWYKLDEKIAHNSPVDIDYKTAKRQLREKLEASVEDRLVADVPLGAFLSGGIDSSLIVALASRHSRDLHTFSIGFADAPFFDETAYAERVAHKFNTRHRVFKLRLNELYEELDEALSFLDEPFADSSALLVYALSKETRKHVTVALSGDGGDELFGGYHKHYGEQMMREGGWKMQAVTALAPLWHSLPRSRQGKVGNKIRQLDRFAQAARLSPAERYWQWCSIATKSEAGRLLRHSLSEEEEKERDNLIRAFTGYLSDAGDLNEVLYSDTKLVLPNDMLTKVDRMSMANSLEVRVPFLDHRVLEYAFSLPPEYKVHGKMKKRIVQDAFRDMLPPELYDRPKRGFELPMLAWMRGPLKERLFDELLTEKRIEAQGLFRFEEIARLKRQLFSRKPGDAPARLYALLVFQTWWKNYFK